jgi:membrane fusion protein, multidrug efflux system
VSFFGKTIERIATWWDKSQPAFWRRMKPAYRAATVFFVLVVVWIGSGQLSHSNNAPDAASQSKVSAIPRVQVQNLVAQDRAATITVHGRTQALHSVDVRSEVEGVVSAIHFEKGDRIKQGALLCEIRVNDREAKLQQMQAMVAQTEKQHAVDLDLQKDGFRSAIQVAQSGAQLEAAKAAERTQQIELDNTKMRAPFDGVVDDRYVDVGDYMRVGDKCAMLIAPEPFLAVGAVSEREVGQIKEGDPASATLVTGETVQGKVRFVADKSDDTTRTFRVEVELPNPDAKLRAGVTADIHVPVRQVKAVKISSGIMVLDDNGVVGVRTVQNGVVRFLPVQIISDGPDGTWVTGLPDNVTVITVGQEFVSDGEHVSTSQQAGHSS